MFMALNSQILNIVIVPLLAVVIAGSLMAEDTFPPVSDADRASMPSAANQFHWTVDDILVAHRNMSAIFPSELIAPSKDPRELPYGDPLGVTYRYGDAEYTATDYMSRNNVTGLLILKEGRIVMEEYAMGNHENTVWASRSMAKSLTSTLVGFALKDGAIDSLDDKVSKYIPELQGNAYGEVTIRQNLQLTTGVPFGRDITNPASDLARLQGCTVDGAPGCIFSLLKEIGARPEALESEGGRTWAYSDGDVSLTAYVVQEAVGMSPALYLQKKLWQPYGMESVAYWNQEARGGAVVGASGFAASLRDYGRFGQFILDDGRLPDGTPLLTENWLEEATT